MLLLGRVCLLQLVMTTQITPKQAKKQLFEEKKRQELAKIEAEITRLKTKWNFEDFESK